MARLRLAYFAVASLFLLGVVVQFFLAGLGVFGAQSFDAHSALGFLLLLLALVLLVFGILGRIARSTLLLTLLLVILTLVQIPLAAAADDIPEVAALHVVNAMAIFVVAHLVVRRTTGYLRSKSTA